MDPRTRTAFASFRAISALASIIICAAAADDATTASSVGMRDGSHDFDFIYGKWRMPNHKLTKRLANSHEWADFVTCDEGRPLPGGIGDIDYWKANYWKDFVGVTVRTYSPKTGLWRIYWVDNTFSGGVMQPPVVGKFEGNVGIFEGPDTFNGKPITVRFTWTLNPGQVAGWSEVGAGTEPQKVAGGCEVGTGVLDGRR